MGAITVSLAEKDILHLVLEFMENRKLFISQASLERETGVINGQYSSDTLFLRQVILDGQWDTALDFVQPLRVTMEFDVKQFEYLIIKHKYYELICVNQEPGPLQNNEFTIEEVLECLRLLECLAPSKKEYNELCLLLTLPKLADHTGFRNWNPSNARAECFAAVYPLVKPFLPLDKKDLSTAYAKDDRLIQLVTKGLFYESCVELCQNKAIRHSIHDEQLSFSSLLNGHKLSSPDISLLTWLEVVPDEVFSLPFEQKALQVRITEHRKPELNACWTEQILQTPIKPNKFPHAAVPTAKFRAAEKLSMSMMPQYEYNSGLCTSLQIDPKTPGNNVFHVGNSSSSSTFTRSLLLDIGGGGRLSQSVVSTVPSFQITQKVATPVADGAQQKSQQPEVNNSTQQQFQANNPAAAMMQQSIDHLLATGDAIATTGGSEQQFFEDSALDGRAAMQKSVYDQLEDIKAKTLQATSVKERGAPVRNKTSSLSTSSYSVLQAPTLPPLPELLGSSEEMAANDPSIENDNTKLYTQFIKQRMQSQPPDTVTPPQSPSAGMKYLMIKSQMETRGVSDMDRSIMDHSVKVSSAVAPPIFYRESVRVVSYDEYRFWADSFT